MKDAVVFLHLGLGDALICNALVRHLAVGRRLVVLAKHHNVESCRFMWRDVPELKMFGVADDKEAASACEEAERHSIPVFRFGAHKTGDAFDIQNWDKEFYRQANLPFRERWDKFKVDRLPERELIVSKDSQGLTALHSDRVPLKEPYAFVHDDPERSCCIRTDALPKLPIIRASQIRGPNWPPNIFDWTGIILGAAEIHVMESCFAILADHLVDPARARLVLHGYTRKSIAPSYSKKWELL